MLVDSAHLQDYTPPWVDDPECKIRYNGPVEYSDFEIWYRVFQALNNREKIEHIERWNAPIIWHKKLFDENLDLPTFIAYFNAKGFDPDDFIFFWGHRQTNNKVTKSCFSQWYESHFTIDGITYPTCEHYLMAEKARLFSDQDSVTKILNSPTPSAVKALGREVKNFNEEVWIRNRSKIAFNGNIEKFKQNLLLKEFLLSTEDKILVEASPDDSIWGIGLASNHPDALDPNKWNGLNILGFTLMQVRDYL